MPKPYNPTIAESRPTPLATDSAPRSRDHIHIANRLLLLAAKASWSGLKLIVKTAIQIPRLFSYPASMRSRPDRIFPVSRPGRSKGSPIIEDERNIEKK
jgi:hypothetical protein